MTYDGESPVIDVTQLPESQIREYAAKHLRKQQQASETAKRKAEKRRKDGLVSRTVHVPAQFADQVGPAIERLIADLRLAEANRNLGVVPDLAQHDDHQPSLFEPARVEWSLNGHSN